MSTLICSFDGLHDNRVLRYYADFESHSLHMDTQTEAGLREFLSCFSLIFRAFPAFCFSVIRCADHKKRPFFIQR